MIRLVHTIKGDYIEESDGVVVGRLLFDFSPLARSGVKDLIAILARLFIYFILVGY